MRNEISKKYPGRIFECDKSPEFNFVLDKGLEWSDYRNVMYFDITEISRKAENDTSLLAEDKLHPSKKMYKMWIEKLKYELLDSLKNS